MAYSESQTEHPGPFIRRHVLPKGVPVTDAARRIGVSRPALSNLLNGKSGLSSDMATRLEKAFGAKRDDLLKMQAAYDDVQSRSRGKEITVRAYARNFTSITASDIEAWSERLNTRALLSVLLRRLIQTTGVNLTKIDFPGYDNSERPGWDGQAETDAATPWIPSGASGWEFGCNENSQQKANDDYSSRVASTSVAERKKITFVFVTPRNWSGKQKWVAARRSEGKWKEVRVLDASDLEQWLEQSAPTQAWLAEQLGVPAPGIASPNEIWDRWAKVTEPELSKTLFSGAIAAHKSGLRIWLDQPPTRPFVIAADSEDEALAFAVCALEAVGENPAQFIDRTIVLRSVEALKKVSTVSSSLVAVLASPDAELASAGLHKSQHTIIVRRRNAVEGEPDIALDLLDDKTFREALAAMGRNEEEIRRLERESGQSPTILRRRLSQVQAIKFPSWSQDHALARKLVPLALVGVWNSETDADQQIMNVLTGEPYQKAEEWIVELLRCDQTPVWSVGRFRGVASKIDALYAISSVVTRKDLEDFFLVAHYVLAEEDPALDLPTEDRWMANIYGKTRNHSAALRKGICETLVLLAVHGNNLFRAVGISVEAQVNRIVRQLLTPVSAKTWASQQHDLPNYAEAAPDEFLDILATDLDSSEPQIMTLLGPASSEIFGGGCPRSGLLWALECLAWKPERLMRVSSLLARLSVPKINDNWANKPENSLEAIFRSWMPQTAATLQQRHTAMEAIARQFPDVGWRLCMSQLDIHGRVGHYSHRPNWRNDASGAGQPTTGFEDHETRRRSFGIAIAWPKHDAQTLGDLIECLPGLSDEYQDKVWEQIKAWVATGPSDPQKARLRERVRLNAFTRRGRRQKPPGKTSGQAAEVYELLQPSDIVNRHHWLFASQWVDESFGELEDDGFDHDRHQRKIAKLRADAIAQIWSALGFNGIVRLCETAEACGTIGGILAQGLLNESEAHDFLYRLLTEPTQNLHAAAENCVFGFLVTQDDTARDSTIASLIKRFSVEGSEGAAKTIRLLRSAPFRKTTWFHVDRLAPDLRKEYWTKVHPRWERQTPTEVQELIERLLEADRPRAALTTIRFDLKDVASDTLIDLLKEVATSSSEPSGHYRIDAHEVSEALTILSRRPEVSRDELAHLEFLYLSALERGTYGIPNLERQIAENASLFMQAIALAYKRSDDREDPAELRRPSSEEGARSVATQAYRLIHKVSRIPGADDNGVIDEAKLKQWITDVRAQCETYARVEIGDQAIGEVLAKSKPGLDGIWPPEPIRKVLEIVGTKNIATGMSIGLYNLRGAHFRGPGGEQERELAAKYRSWSKDIAFESPFVSRMLENIARSYDRDAEWHDTDADISKRLTY